MTDTSFLSASEWLPDALLLVTPDGFLLGANRAARALFGDVAEHGNEGEALLRALDDEVSLVLRYLKAGARTRQPLPGALLLKHGVEKPRRFRSTVRLLQPATANEPALLLLHLQAQEGASSHFKQLNDRLAQMNSALRRQKEADEERRRLEAQMLQTQKLESLGVLAGGIAHDFNNLLTSVIGYCDLARGEVTGNTSAREFLDEAVTGARRAAELTQQMLAYSGKGTLVVGPVQLSALVTDITRLLEVSISKKCVLRYNLMENLPTCRGDATQLRQVIMNLIINASDAIGERSGVIALTTGVAWCDSAYLAENFVDDNLPEGLYVHLEVADTGSGMSHETRQRIFDPFFTTKFTGRGLGLAAVLGIVRGHNGAIRVYSELGRGTTFKMLLPAEQQLEQQSTLSTPDTAMWRGAGSVLVVDDEESIRGLTRHMLTQMGFDVATASDGREAVELFRQMQDINPLVLLDLTMPHLDGAAAFTQLKRIRPDVRVILMSGYNEHSIAEQFAGKGPLGFIQKPFRLSELRQLVRSTLESVKV
jgi:signal transduction histidine kinase/ActR/RegA family two-component response regulator